MTRSVRSSIFLAVLICMVPLATTAQSASEPPAYPLANLPTIAPVLECEKLASLDLHSAVGAQVRITSAKTVPEARPAGYCDVLGQVAPAIRFEVRLPLANWTQRYLQTGCGGTCGQLSIRTDRQQGCAPATNGQIVLASTDMGHASGMGDDGSWGSADRQTRVDFAYRGVHLTALAAKALIAAYYGQPAKYSYFSGCSDGGREALMEAQRFPLDFNGITAGAPAMNFTTQNTFYHGWNVDRNRDQQGQWILTAAQLPLLHQLALQQCDAQDGLKDGLISNPALCHVDPAQAQCPPGQSSTTCLTPEQVRVAREIYAGAHDAEGRKLVLSGPLPGSELGWAGVLVPGSGGNFVMGQMAASSALKHLVYEQDPPASFTVQDLQFTPDNFTRTTQLHGLYDATDPNLAPFAAAGGKLILWHGWADPHISPLNTIAYYTAMQKLLGEPRVDTFARIFLFPGGYHCGGGEGPFDFPLLSAIMAWVENQQAPQVMIASHTLGGPHGPVQGVPGPPRGAAPMQEGPANPSAAHVDRTRPVYPYPFQAQYNGTGSIDDASNFHKGEAKPVSAEQLQWLGASFYAPHYEKWCQVQNGALVCSPQP